MTKNSSKKLREFGIPKPSLKSKTKDNKKIFLTYRELESVNQKHQVQVRFSFIYFDRKHELFTCGKAPHGWFLVLFENLKEISKLTKNEFLYNPKYKNHYDPHQHNWSELDKRRHYPLPENMFEQIKDDCWQFRLSTSNGRVHGFMIENVFYIVWLDPHHNFYPNEKFGGEKYYDAPLTPYQTLEIEYNNLQEEYKKLKEENEFLFQMLEEYEKQLNDFNKNSNNRVI